MVKNVIFTTFYDSLIFPVKKFYDFLRLFNGNLMKDLTKKILHKIQFLKKKCHFYDSAAQIYKISATTYDYLFFRSDYYISNFSPKDFRFWTFLISLRAILKINFFKNRQKILLFNVILTLNFTF